MNIKCNIIPAKIPKTSPAILPSMLFLGLILGHNLCLPNFIPNRYAKESVAMVMTSAKIISASPSILFILLNISTINERIREMYIRPNIEYIVVSASNFLSSIFIIDMRMIIIGMEGITKLKSFIANIKSSVPDNIYIILDKSRCFPLSSITFIYSYSDIIFKKNASTKNALLPIIIAMIKSKIIIRELINLFANLFHQSSKSSFFMLERVNGFM